MLKAKLVVKQGQKVMGLFLKIARPHIFSYAARLFYLFHSLTFDNDMIQTPSKDHCEEIPVFLYHHLTSYFCKYFISVEIQGAQSRSGYSCKIKKKDVPFM